MTFALENLAPSDVDPQTVVPSAYLASQSKQISPREAARLGLGILARMDTDIARLEQIIAPGNDANGNLKEMRDVLLERRSALPEVFPLDAATLALRRVPPHRRVDGGQVLDAVLRNDPRVQELLTPEAQVWLKAHVGSGAAFAAETAQHTAEIQTAMDTITVQNAKGPRLHWSEVQGYDAWEEAATLSRASIPVRLTYAVDAPASWWGIEEAGVAYAAARRSSDLGQLLIAAAFAHPGALDLLVTVDVPTNTLVRMQDVTLQDGFDRKTIVTSAEGGATLAWKDDRNANWMPLLADTPLLEGRVTDLVAFGADDTDNIVWMEERLVPDGDGRGVPPRVQRADRSTDEAVMAVRLPPPSNWHPYLIENEGTLSRKFMARDTGTGALETLPPVSSLAPQSLDLTPQQISPKGFALQRRWVLARAPDGSRQVWQVACSAQARFGGSSGLAHDLVLCPDAQ